MLTESIGRRLGPELECRVQSGLAGASRGDPFGRELEQVLERGRRTDATDEQVALALGIVVALSSRATSAP